MKLYIASLADYNEGRLVGRWIDASDDADEMRAEVAAMLAEDAAIGAEEFAIHDYDGFHPVKISEFESLDTIAAIVEAVEGTHHSEAAMLAYFEHEGIRDADDVRAMAARFEDCYRGTWRTLEEYADDFIDSTGMLEGLPENLRYYFNVEAFARDLRIGGDVFTIDVPGGVAVFDNA